MLELKEAASLAVFSCAGNRDTPLESILRWFIPKLVCDGGDQPMPGLQCVRAGIQEQETAGSISILCLSRFKAGLPYKCGLLIAQVAGNRHITYAGYLGPAVDFTAWSDARQHTPRNLQRIQYFFILIERLKIHELSTTGV